MAAISVVSRPGIILHPPKAHHSVTTPAFSIHVKTWTLISIFVVARRKPTHVSMEAMALSMDATHELISNTRAVAVVFNQLKFMVLTDVRRAYALRFLYARRGGAE